MLVVDFWGVYSVASKSLLDNPNWWKFCEKYRYDLFAFAVDCAGITPTHQQQLLFESIQFDGSRTTVASGHGCFAKGTMIRLFNGETKPVEEITTDDQVMGDDGMVRDIISLVTGEEEMFTFSFSNGLKRTFNKSHILNLVCLKNGRGWKAGTSRKVRVSQWLKWSDHLKSLFGFKQVKNDNYSRPSRVKILNCVSEGMGQYYGFSLFDNSSFLDADGLILENTGKTASAGITALWHLLCFPNSIMMFTAPQIKQLKGQVWKEIDLSLSRMRKTKYAWIADYVVSLTEMIYVAGHQKTWHVFAKTAPKHSPSNIAGNHGDNYMVWVDEACGVSNEVLDVVFGALTHDDNRAVMTSQPASNVGMFYDSHHRLSHKNGGKWIALRFNGEESPIVGIEALKEQLAKYGNRKDPQYKIRVLGEFPELLGKYLIGRTDADKCYTRPTALRKKHSDFGYVISVDVGGGVGRDYSVITVCRMWGTDQYGEFERRVDILDIPLFKNTDNIDDLLNKIYELLNLYPNATLVVDQNGVGRGLGQKLRSAGQDFLPVNWGGKCFSEEDRKIFKNKRSRAYVGLKNAIQRGNFKILTENHSAKILEQITTIPFIFDEESRYTVLSKEEMKKKGIPSPDLIDTFAFLFLHNLNYVTAFESNTSEAVKRKQKRNDIRALARKQFG